MASCINYKHPEVVKMAGELNISPVVLAAKIGVWQEKNNVTDRFPSKEEILQPQEINYVLKSVEILSSDKAKEVFEKGNKNNWSLDKILSELQIPKEQKQLILDSNKTELDDVVTDLLANYSYTVEINTAKAANKFNTKVDDYGNDLRDSFDDEDNSFYYNDYLYEKDIKHIPFGFARFKDNVWEPISANSYWSALEQKEKEGEMSPTQYHSRLTVPGGTNYTENAFETPFIFPSIIPNENHKPFNTEHNIGWFRSDEEYITSKDYPNSFDDEHGTWFKENDVWKFLDDDGFLHERSDLDDTDIYAIYDNQYGVKGYIQKGTNTNVRRILEVQSDLFQKGRDKEDLIGKVETEDDLQFLIEMGATPDDIQLEKLKRKGKENQFLQLLNKDNNWVTFFVKSIIQDSVRKGYEKVLFPTGKTISTIEGFNSLDNHLNILKSDLENYEKELKEISENGYHSELEIRDGKYYDDYNDVEITKEEYDKLLKERTDKEIELVLKDIEEVTRRINEIESEYNEKYPVINFYEKTLKRVLEKNGYNPILITDEYGNTWNEVVLKESDKNSILFNKIEDIIDENKKEEIFSISKNIPETKKDNKILNESIFFASKKQNEYSLNEIVNNVLNSKQSFSDSFNLMLNKLSKISLNTNSKVKVITRSSAYEMNINRFNDNVAMFYDERTNAIYAIEESLSNFSPEVNIQSFVHETVHAITVKALKNPETFEEREFKKLIEEAYEQYKTLELQDRTNAYGFENIYEFVAEIYSNQEFQNNLRKKQSLWQRFKDELRRLLGLVKNKVMDELIDATLLIDTVNDFVENTDANNFKGFAKDSIIFDAYFRKIESVITSPKEGYDIKSLQDKVDKKLNDIKDSIDSTINVLKNRANSSKDEKIKDRFKNMSDKYKDILDKLEQNDNVDNLSKILNYISFMQDNISSLRSSFSRKEFDDEHIQDVLHSFEKYLDTFSIHSSIKDLFSDIIANNKFSDEDIVGKEDLKLTSKMLDEIGQNYNSLISEFKSYSNIAFKKKISNLKYLPELEYKWKQALYKIFKEEKIQGDRESWVSKQMNGEYKKNIERDIETYVDQIINSPSYDIPIANVYLSSNISTNSTLVQIFNQMLNEIRENIRNESLKTEKELYELFQELSKEKNTTDVSKLYENILQQDSNGVYYLKSEYTLKFKEELDKVKAELKEAIYGTDEYKSLFRKKNKIINNHKSYLNNKKLSTVEQKVLDKFIEITRNANRKTYGQQSLIDFAGNDNVQAFYLRLPSVTKTDMERVLSGDIKGTITDKWKDLTEIRPDDVDFRYKTDNQNNILHNINIRYRGKIDSKDQSIDLFSLYRLENLNGINFREKYDKLKDLNTILDIAKSKDYYRTKSGKEIVKSIFRERNKEVLMSGEESNTYKMLKNSIEKDIYDIGNHYAGKIGPVDANKAIGFINSATASIGLNLNRYAATANVINAKAQMFLETISKGVIDNKNLAKAEKLYGNDLKNIINDLGKPFESSFVNQMNRMFDTFGFSQNHFTEYVKAGVLKSYTNAGSLQFMHKGGEHWVQSVLTAAVLDSVKVMDSENNFIDKNGNVVDKNKAASLLDMLYIDKADGILKISDKVVYTTHSLTSKINDGGKNSINLLVERKIKDCFGNFNPNTQPEAKRHWLGKLLMMFKSFFVEMATRRYRGFSNSTKSKDEIESNPEKYKYFSYALKDYEEGTYTTFTRFMINGVWKNLKQFQFQAMSSEFNKLSDLEKANFKHALSEFITTMIILPLAIMAMGANGDDDDDLPYFWMYQARRLSTELAQFRNPSENVKLTRSPIPSMRIIESALDAVGKTINPWTWSDEYKSGPHKGELKLTRSYKKMIPVLNQIGRDSKDLYQYQNSVFGIY